MNRFGVVRCAGMALAALMVAATALPMMAKAAEQKRPEEGNTVSLPNKARCKFRCAEVEPNPWGEGQKVKLAAEYDDPLTGEDVAFSQYTPWGNFESIIQNPNLQGFFEAGKSYYIDVTPVPTPPPNTA